MGNFRLLTFKRSGRRTRTSTSTKNQARTAHPPKLTLEPLETRRPLSATLFSSS